LFVEAGRDTYRRIERRQSWSFTPPRRVLVSVPSAQRPVDLFGDSKFRHRRISNRATRYVLVREAGQDTYRRIERRQSWSFTPPCRVLVSVPSAQRPVDLFGDSKFRHRRISNIHELHTGLEGTTASAGGL
jgi:hypothetical protein